MLFHVFHMSKTVLEVDPELQREAKIIAAQKGCTMKHLTRVIFEKGISDVKNGKLKIKQEGGSK